MVFGFGKKKVSAEEFGEGAIRMAGDIIEGDYIRGCVGILDPHYNYSEGDYLKFMDEGIGEEQLQLGRIAFYHATLQASCHVMRLPKTKEVVKGASEIMAYRTSEFYDFDNLFNSLNRLYRGETQSDYKDYKILKLDWHVNEMSADSWKTKYMSASVNAISSANARLILQEYLPFPFDKVDLDDKYSMFYSTCSAAIGTMERAIMDLNRKFKIE